VAGNEGDVTSNANVVIVTIEIGENKIATFENGD